MMPIKIHSVRYSPGYGDMRGEYHNVSLTENKDGDTVMICTDRDFFNAPEVVTTYAVGPAALASFEKFLAKKNIPSLALRPKSDLFATDYSPWSWYIVYDAVLFGKTTRKECSIKQYRMYSPIDRMLLNELEERFSALRGEQISTRTVERDI